MAKYAVIVLHNLRVITREDKEGWKEVMNNLKSRKVKFIALKFNTQLKGYYQLEIGNE